MADLYFAQPFLGSKNENGKIGDLPDFDLFRLASLQMSHICQGR